MRFGPHSGVGAFRSLQTRYILIDRGAEKNWGAGGKSMIACMQTIIIPPQGHAATSDGDGWETVCRPGRPRPTPTPAGERTAPRIRDATARAPHPGLNTSPRPGRPLVAAASVNSLGEASDHPLLASARWCSARSLEIGRRQAGKPDLLRTARQFRASARRPAPDGPKNRDVIGRLIPARNSCCTFLPAVICRPGRPENRDSGTAPSQGDIRSGKLWLETTNVSIGRSNR